MSKKLTALAGAIAIASSAGAYAGVLESYLAPGANIFEDDSGEVVFRLDPADGTYKPFIPTYGAGPSDDPLMVGDIVVGLLDYPQTSTPGNAQNIDANGDEVSGIFVVSVDAIADAGTASASGISYDAIDITFGAGGAAAWSDATGISLAGLEGSLGLAAGDLDSTFYMLFDDSVNNIDTFTQDYATVLGNILEGNLRLVAGTGQAGTYVTAEDAPENIDEFLNPGYIPAISELGDFEYAGAVLWDNIAGEQDFIFGSGSNIVPAAGQPFGIADDTQTVFNAIPEPSSLMLLGIGAIGMGLRMRKKS